MDKSFETDVGKRRIVSILFVFAATLCCRMPHILIQGRFWAEEGHVFFHNAWVMPPGRALLFPFGGYLNLIANAATLAARRLMPLAYAPYLTMGTGLLFQLFPPLLLLLARDGWLKGPYILHAAILLLLLVPRSEEVSLQSLHCQFELMLCCAIILALEIGNGKTRIFHFILLFFAPLSGPGAIVLAPLFLLRAAWDRSRERLAQSLFLAAGSAIQLAFFYQFIPERDYALHPAILLAIFTVRHLEMPFLGPYVSMLTASAIWSQLADRHVPLYATLPPLAACIPLAFATLFHPRYRPAFWFFVAGCLIAVASYSGAAWGAAQLIDAYNCERYTVVPQALFCLTLLCLAATVQNHAASVFFRMLVLWMLVVGAVTYFLPWPFTVEGPSWREEVALWKRQPQRPLRIWPKDWTLTLPSISNLAQQH